MDIMHFSDIVSLVSTICCYDIAQFIVSCISVLCRCGLLLWPPYVIGGPLYFCSVIFFYLLSIYLSFFFLPNLSGRRLDVYHTLTCGVALWRI